jgi:hypothetical protein
VPTSRIFSRLCRMPLLVASMSNDTSNDPTLGSSLQFFDELEQNRNCLLADQVGFGLSRLFRPHVRFGSKADICNAPTHVRFTPNSDRESGFPHKVMSALPPKADMCSALAYVRFGPKADASTATKACQQLPFFLWPGGQKPFRSHLVGGRTPDAYPE